MYFSDRLYSHEELPFDFKLALSEMAHDIDKEMADQPSGVPAGSEHQGHDSGYNEPRSEMSCQTTDAAQDCTEWSSLKLWDMEVSICKAGNTLFPVSLALYPTFPIIINTYYPFILIIESPFSLNTVFYQLFIITA